MEYIAADFSYNCINTLLNAVKKRTPLFLYNPKLPELPEIKNPPPALMLLTSGSTGKPKVAVLPYESLLANAEHSVPLEQGDIWRLTLPLYHVGGVGIVLRCFVHGATVTIEDRPDITHLSYVPTQLYRATPVYKNLKCLLLGGAPIHNMPERLPIHTSYGLTEMGSMVALDGCVLPKRELKIENGEIFVKGACLFQGYLGEEKQEGWFPTKDLGEWQNGKLHIVGRKDWMFISGGENIQPEEIEKELQAIAGVEEAVVVGKSDPEFGKRPLAFIVGSLTKEKMQSILSEKLPRYKIPVDIKILQEMPRKNNFKINRFILSELANNK